MDGRSPEETFLVRVNKGLPSGWQCRLNQDGRLYYLNHNDHSSHWIPPRSYWPRSGELPYGWESATDNGNKEYFINHRTCTTTHEDPFDLEDAPPEERDVVLTRDAALGFGFIAGSEKPVVVRSVTEGGPSIEKLLPGDEILKVNGEDVRDSDRQYIIDKIRFSDNEIALTVVQPYIDKTGLKSSFLSATKKQKHKVKPPRVRFAESVNTFPSNSPKIPPSLVYLPDVLKVYLENGQTKSFKYDDDTTVKDLLLNLKEKLAIKSLEYFALVVQDVRDTQQHKFVVLRENETLRQLADRPGSKNWKCFLRVMFVPSDAFDLLNDDPNSFEYFFSQCCNDVLQEHFASELKPDTAIRLAALHICQHLLASRQITKVSIKALEKDDNLTRFLPGSILSVCKVKELRKLISQHMKANNNLTAPGQKHLTELQAKLHYLKIIGELKSFGTKSFLTTILDFPAVDQQSDARVVIGPRCDVSLIGKTGDRVPLLHFDQLTRILLTVESGTEEGVHRVELHQKSGQPIVFLMQTDEAEQMASFINGYYKLLVHRDRSLLSQTIVSPLPHATAHAPAYHGKHYVRMAKWSYADDLASEVIPEDDNTMAMLNWKNQKQGQRWVDLATGPPPYQDDPTAQRARDMQQTDTIHQEQDNQNKVNRSFLLEGLREERKEQWEDDEQGSSEKLDGEKEEEDILSMLSSEASSPESDASITMATEYSDVDEATTGFGESTADLLHNGHSQATGVTLHHVSPTDKLDMGEKAYAQSPEGQNKKLEKNARREEGREERPNSRLRARDSILIQQRKMSPMMQRRMESYESETEADSFDSDVIDLTGISGIDFGPDLHDTGDVSFNDTDMDSVFIEFVSEGGNPEETVETHEKQSDCAEMGAQVYRKQDEPQSDEIEDKNCESEKQNVSNTVLNDNDALPVEGNAPLNLSPEKSEAHFEDKDASDDGDKSRNLDSDSNSEIKDVSIEDCASEKSEVDTDESETLSCRSDEDVDIPGLEDDGSLSGDERCSLDHHSQECNSDRESNAETLMSVGGNESDGSVDGDERQRRHQVEENSCDEESNGANSVPAGDVLDGSLNSGECCHVDLQDQESSSDWESNNATSMPVGGDASDEAHGMQLAALLALDASLEETEESSKAEGPFPSTNNYESDSGNETISSELENNNSEQPTDGSFEVEVSNIDRDFCELSPSDIAKGKVSRVSWKEEDSQGLLASAVPCCGTSSDTESTSTLHGSTPNLSIIDTGEDDEPPTVVQSKSPTPMPSVSQVPNEIALIVPLPPPVECEEVDEELLYVVIPPPAMEGFDEGPLYNVFQQDAEVTSSLPKEHLEDHVMATEVPVSPSTIPINTSICNQSDIDEEMRVADNVNNSDGNLFGVENDNACADDEDKCLGSEDDLDEEAGLRDLLEIASDRTYSVPVGIEVGKESPNATQGEISKDEVGSAMSRDSEPENSTFPQKEETDNSFGEDGNLEFACPTQLQKSPEQKVADILESIITGCLSTSPSFRSSPVRSVSGAASAHTQEKLIAEGEVNSSIGLYMSDKDQVHQTETLDSLFITEEVPEKDVGTIDDSEVTSAQEISQHSRQSPSRGSAPKPPGVKPNIPPKPAKPARPKDLKLKMMACEMNSSQQDVTVSPASELPESQQPPQPPPRRRYTAPGIAARASKFENFRGDGGSDDTKISPHFQASVLAKANAPQLPLEAVSENIYSNVASGRNPEMQSHEASKSRVARSHTFSGAHDKSEPNKLQPSRRAPPPPLPKPKPVLTHSLSCDKFSPRVENSPAAKSPHGSGSRKSFAGSLSRLLTPSKHKSWGQFRDSLPFKNGSLKGNGSSRAKVKARKPLKALWPSATCDDNHEKERNIKPIGYGERNLDSIIQRSASVEFGSRSEGSTERKTRSLSVNVIPSNSEESVTESGYGGSGNGEPLWGAASSSMISLTSSYPTAYSQSRKPPPRPSNPPVLKAASLSRLTSPSFIPSDPALFSAIRTDSVSSELSQASSKSPSPPPLPLTMPPEFTPSDGLLQISTQSWEDDNDTIGADDSFIVAVESKEYTGVTAIRNAISDIEMLTRHMNYWLANFLSKPDPREFRQAKEVLLCEVREFTSNTKMVVTAAGQTGQQLRESANSSMHTLARLCSATHQCMAVMASAAQARNLVKKVEDITRNFSTTLQAANEACGKSLSDSRMQQLLRQAQTMAALLSALMRSLRMLQQ